MTQMRRLCSLTVNKQLAVVGCSLHEYVVLVRLSYEDDVPQHELAYDAAIDPAAASRLVRDMSKAGLVTTEIHPTDKRQRYVKITSKGRTLERTLSPVVDSALEPLMGGLSEADEQSFLSLLRKAYVHAVAADAELSASDTRAPVVRAREEPEVVEVAARPKRASRRSAV